MLTRRSLLGLLAALACCESKENGRLPSQPTPPAPPRSSVSVASPQIAAPSASSPAPFVPKETVAVSEINFSANDGGPQGAIILRPQWLPPSAKLPVLIALHGQGEARKGLNDGKWGWVRDYWLDKAINRLRQGSALKRADFQGHVSTKRLDEINDSLRDHPFQGLIIACPYTPDLMVEKSLDNAGPFASFLLDKLLPKLHQDYAITDGNQSVGIDGVSLGGRIALMVGLSNPLAFGSLGSIQSALRGYEADELVRRSTAALKKNPSLRLRLLTSESDFYKAEIKDLHNRLLAAKVPHDHSIVFGPHGYSFNRGPGAIEMLLWHDRVLRGEKPV